MLQTGDVTLVLCCRQEMRRDGVTLLAAVHSLSDCDSGLRRLDEALCLLTVSSSALHCSCF